jgi:hypothetical protein
MQLICGDYTEGLNNFFLISNYLLIVHFFKDPINVNIWKKRQRRERIKEEPNHL